jgi:hypothetical protein
LVHSHTLRKEPVLRIQPDLLPGAEKVNDSLTMREAISSPRHKSRSCQCHLRPALRRDRRRTNRRTSDQCGNGGNCIRSNSQLRLPVDHLGLPARHGVGVAPQTPKNELGAVRGPKEKIILLSVWLIGAMGHSQALFLGSSGALRAKDSRYGARPAHGRQRP